MRTLVMTSMMAMVACNKGATTTSDSGPTNEYPSTGTPTGTPPAPETPFDDFVEADLADDAAIAALSAGSAAHLFQHHEGLVGLAFNSFDPKCPTLVQNYGTTTSTISVTGGCTDDDGNVWVGSAEAQFVGYDVTIVFDGLGVTLSLPCGYTSSVIVAELSATGTLGLASDGSFVLDTEGTTSRIDGATCSSDLRTFKAQYAGTRESIGYDDLYNGAGTYADAEFGKADVVTINEFLGGACSNEADSGVTLFSTSSHDASLNYDGQFQCDYDGSVPWSLDGVAQGTIAGIFCNSTGNAPAAFALLVPLMLAARRRRS